MKNQLLASLQRYTHALIDELDRHPVSARLFDGTIDRHRYAAYLLQTYHYVRWTSRLLRAAGARLREMGTHPELAALLVQKAGEELGHERWALADLRVLGVDESAIARSRPGAAARSYIAWNRYTAEVGEPAAFLGTAYVLEVLAAERAPQAVARLRERGSPRGAEGAVTFLAGHAAADMHHVAELHGILAELGDSGCADAIALSARITCALVPGLFATDLGATAGVGGGVDGDERGY